jgi:hypothetical protein
MQPKLIVGEIDNPRVTFAQREEALRKLNEWGWNRAKECARRAKPDGTEEEIEFLARVVLDLLARENFAKSKAGFHT